MAGSSLLYLAAIAVTGAAATAVAYFFLSQPSGSSDSGPQQPSNGASDKNGKNTGTVGSGVAEVANGAKMGEQAEKLRHVYAEMLESFVTSGLDLDAISKVRTGFRGLEGKSGALASPGKQPVAPKVYEEDYPGGPYAAGSIRLIVLPMDSNSKLSSAGESVTREVLKHLPFVKDVFRNARGDYHVTVYHTSKAEYPCPDATRKDGGVDPATAAGERPGPTPEYVEKERAWTKRVAAGMAAPELEFERFIFTTTGTLLMTWTDPSGKVEEIRKQCREAWPGALHIKQSNILHCSLLRLLSVQPLDDYIRQKIAASCDKWTEKCKGWRWQATCAWHVVEEEFSTIAGDRAEFPFQS